MLGRISTYTSEKILQGREGFSVALGLKDCEDMGRRYALLDQWKDNRPIRFHAMGPVAFVAHGHPEGAVFPDRLSVQRQIPADAGD